MILSFVCLRIDFVAREFFLVSSIATHIRLAIYNSRYIVLARTSVKLYLKFQLQLFLVR